METLEGAELCFPQLLNSSCKEPKRAPFEPILVYILQSSVSLLTASLNLLVIISISHFKQLHTSTNILLLSLAVSDFFVGFLMFFEIVLINGCWILSELMCVLYLYTSYIITSVSIGTMVLISVDRYVAICDPLHYPTKVTVRGVQKCVCVCWIWSVFFQSCLQKDLLKQPVRYNPCFGECVVVLNYIAGLADLILTFIVPILVIIVLYVRVFVVAVSQARAMRSHVAAVSLSVNVKKSELKAARTLGTVIVVFLICLCPYFCVNLAGHEAVINASFATFVVYLFYFNSCLNPVIYAFFYPWFRKSVKMIVTLKILKPGSCEANML